MADTEPVVTDVQATDVPEPLSTPAPEKSEAEQKQEELNDRVNKFIAAYGALVKEHKIDFASYPMFVPDGNGGFKIIVQSTPVDIGDTPIKSPFIPQS